MSRINAKGLLIKDISDLYQNAIKGVFEDSKLPEKDFKIKLEEKRELINETFVATVLEGHKKGYTIEFPPYHKNILKVQRAIGKIYEEPFQYYFTYLSTCHELLNNLFEQLDADVTNETDVVVISLYGHLLRKADQVGIMLLNGYHDAALIIWRAFYEFAVTLKLLAEQDSERLTRKFIRHQVHRSKRLMESYNKRLVAEGFDPVSGEELKVNAEEMEQLIKDYGKSFTDGEYGWAEGIPDLKARPTFANLEELTSMGRYRPFYIFASGYTHASFAVFDNINENGLMRIERIKDVQPQLEDFVDPMQITLAVLEDINSALIKLISVDDEIELNTDLFNELYMQLIRYFQDNTEED